MEEEAWLQIHSINLILSICISDIIADNEQIVSQIKI